MDLTDFEEWRADHPELADVPTFDQGMDELRTERLLGANNTWRSAPVTRDQRMAMVLIRWGWRVRRFLRID